MRKKKLDKVCREAYEAAYTAAYEESKRFTAFVLSLSVEQLRALVFSQHDEIESLYVKLDEVISVLRDSQPSSVSIGDLLIWGR